MSGLKGWEEESVGLSSMIDFPGDHFLLLLPFAYERVLQSLSLVPMELPG